MKNLKVKRLNESAKLPTRAHPTDAGLDLYALQHTLEDAVYLVSTGISIAIPDGYVGLVWDKSGIVTNTGLHVVAGVIDSSYRGEVKVAIVNLSNKNRVIKVGQKIAQLLIVPIITPNVEEVKELDETDRGINGFGSTGI